MYNLICLECSKPFSSPNKTKKCCSPACASKLGTKQRSRKVSCICEVCGKVEERSPSHAHHKYCSTECKGIASRKPDIIKTCPICDKSFILSTKHQQQEFCSGVCAGKARQNNTEHICLNCGETFYHRRGTRIPSYCSVMCMAEGYKKPLHERDCAYCGKTFLPKRKSSKYCSPSCRAKVGKVHLVKPISCVCVFCGKQETRLTRERRKYCSDECKKNAKRQRKSLYKFTYSQKQTIKERDGFKCVICESDFQIEIDHILAIALGGLNTLENGQTLCHDCHLEKTAQDKILIRTMRKHN